MEKPPQNVKLLDDLDDFISSLQMLAEIYPFSEESERLEDLIDHLAVEKNFLVNMSIKHPEIFKNRNKVGID